MINLMHKVLAQVGVVHGVYDVSMLTSPYCDILNAYLTLLGSAKNSIRIIDYSATNLSIARELVTASKHAIDVKEIFDLKQAPVENNFFDILKTGGQQEGRDYLLGVSPVGNRIVHMKTTIVDDEWVELGSWNYTNLAQQEVNNIVIIHSSEVAMAVQGVFDALWKFNSRPPLKAAIFGNPSG